MKPSKTNNGGDYYVERKSRKGQKRAWTDAGSTGCEAECRAADDINMGKGAIVIGLAAVIIGEAIFGKIFRNFALRLLSVAFGSILYYLVLQTVIWLGIDTDLLKMLSALVVAIFLAVPYWKAKYFSKPTKRGGNN